MLEKGKANNENRLHQASISRVEEKKCRDAAAGSDFTDSDLCAEAERGQVRISRQWQQATDKARHSHTEHTLRLEKKMRFRKAEGSQTDNVVISTHWLRLHHTHCWPSSTADNSNSLVIANLQKGWCWRETECIYRATVCGWQEKWPQSAHFNLRNKLNPDQICMLLHTGIWNWICRAQVQDLNQASKRVWMENGKMYVSTVLQKK